MSGGILRGGGGPPPILMGGGGPALVVDDAVVAVGIIIGIEGGGWFVEVSLSLLLGY